VEFTAQSITANSTGEVAGSIPTRFTGRAAGFAAGRIRASAGLASADRRLTPFLLLMLLLVSKASSVAQQSEQTYRLTFQNHYVRVFELTLAPGRQAPVRDNIYDVFWIALDDTTLEIDRHGPGKKEFRLWSGDVQFLPARTVHSVVNLNRDPVRAVLVELRQRGLTGRICDCSGEVETAVCGCSRSARLPSLWALVLGDLTLSGATLPPEQAVQQQRTRGDTLLIAVTPLHLLHERNQGREWEWIASAPSPLALQAGEVSWIARGKHHLRNNGSTTVRFLTLEFPDLTESPSNTRSH
jgi:mannose-6-phosphate isomerase-like protein (cupin superfamily)